LSSTNESHEENEQRKIGSTQTRRKKEELFCDGLEENGMEEKAISNHRFSTTLIPPPLTTDKTPCLVLFH